MLPNSSHRLVLLSPLQKTGCWAHFPAHMLYPQPLAAACDGYTASEVHAVTQGQKHPVHQHWDHMISLYPKFPFFFFFFCPLHYSGGYKQQCCADKLNEKTPDFLDFFLCRGSIFSSVFLWSLSACSAESSKSVSAAKEVFDMFLGCNVLQGYSALL